MRASSLRMRKYAPLLILAFAGCGPCGYNRSVTEEQQVESAWSPGENQLQRRADLIHNLVEAVKVYPRHQKCALVAIATVRAAKLWAGSRAFNIQTRKQGEGGSGK